jgi:pimeloyl-ACP methyl ester carboxylesterase
LPRSRLVFIAGAGHLPVLERPEPTAAELAAWLAA